MKETSNAHVFHHPWDTVVKAVWRKYPNPLTTSVIGTDIIDRNITDKGVLKTHRLMLTEWFIPKTFRRWLGQDSQAYGSEHSVCDPKKKSFTLRTKNITFSSVVTIDETLTYSPHPEFKDKTCLTQSTKVKLNINIPMLGDYLEGYLIENIANNTHKGRDAMEWVIDKIKNEADETLRNVDEMLTTFTPGVPV